MERSSGILLHISSLPSPHGIGTFGKAAYRFADFLHEAGQSYWQILPTCIAGAGGSPYQSISAFACNPYFIDMDILEDEGLLEKGEAARLCRTAKRTGWISPLSPNRAIFFFLMLSKMQTLL